MDAGLKRKAAATAAQRKKPRRDKSEFVSVEVGMREFKKRLAATDAKDASIGTNTVENLTQDIKVTKARAKAVAARKTDKETTALKKATPAKKTVDAKKAPVKRTTRRTTAKMTLAEVKAQLEREQKERVEYRIQTLQRDTKPTAASSASVAAVSAAPVTASPVQQEVPVAADADADAVEQQSFSVNEAVLNAVQSGTIHTHVQSRQTDASIALPTTQSLVSAAPVSAELPSSPAKNKFIVDDVEEDIMFAMALEEVERKLATPQKPLSNGDVIATDTNMLTSTSLQTPVASPTLAKSSPAEPQVQMQPTQVTVTYQPQQTEAVVGTKQQESVVVVAPEILEEMERLKRENESLRRSNELLQAAVTSPVQTETPPVDAQPSRSPKDANAYDGKNPSVASPSDTSPYNPVAKSTARYLDLARCDSDQDMKEAISALEDGDTQELGSRHFTENESALSEQQPDDIQGDVPSKEKRPDEHQNKPEDDNDFTAEHTEPALELSSTVIAQDQTPSTPPRSDRVTSDDTDDHSPAQPIATEQENESPEKTQSTGLSSLKENIDDSVHVTSESGNGDESDASMSEGDKEEDEEEDQEGEDSMEVDGPASRASTIDSGNYSEYKYHQGDDFDADDDECLEDKGDSTAIVSERKVDPTSSLSVPVDIKPCDTMVMNEPATQVPGTPANSENLERTTAPSNTEDEEDGSEDEDEMPVVSRVKRREAIALSSSSSSSESESEDEEDEADDTPSSNVLEAALKAAGGDSGSKNRAKLSSNVNDAVQKGESAGSLQNSKSTAASISSPSLPVKTVSKKRKTPGLSSTTTKKQPSVKSSLLWPALDEFYDFLLDMSPRNARGSQQRRVHLQRYGGGKLPAQHSTIEDYCSVQLEAIMDELVASVSNTTDRRGGGGSGPIRHLSLASVSPCGVQGMSAASVGLSLGAIFSESGFTGSTSSNNDYILTFDASALGKKALSDFMSGDLILVRSPRWKNYEMCVFGVVLCNSVVAVGGKGGSGGKGGGGGSGESDQICVLIRAQKRDRDDAVKNFSVLTELCLSNQRAPNWRWSLQQVHNTTTSAREFQAIKAISFFPNDFKQVLLRGQLPATKTEQTSKKSVASSSILSPRLLKYLHKHYNDSQVEAILGCLGEHSRVIIQGPPGTGKTKTILGLLSALLDGAGLSTLQKTKGTARIRVGASLQSARTSAVSKTVAETSIRVLVAAPSNAAVDELVVRVLSEGLFDGEKGESYRPRIVRVGRPESSQQLSSLAAAREASESKKNRKKMRKYAREVEEVLLESLVTKHRSTFATVKQARQAIIKNAQIVFCTLSGAGSVAMCEFAQDFDALIIDEAAQAVEASTLIPFKFRPHRVVLVGDHRQLPATVISKKLVSMGYDRSLQQRLVENGSPVLLLNQQYRMHPEIAKFPSTYFYGGRLVQGDNMSEWTAQDYHRDRAFKPLLFLDVEGAQSQVSGSTSLRNMSEVEAVIQLVQRLLTKFPSIDWKKRIGVIAPYKQQIYEVRGAIGKLETEFDRRLGIEVNTVDGFQGREKEIIIYSCVRTSHGSRRKKKRQSHNNDEEDDVLDAFWADERRMNVAITRAKSSLWIVGNSTLLKQSRAWRALIQHSKDQDRYISDGATLFATSSSTQNTSKASSKPVPPAYEARRRRSEWPESVRQDPEVKELDEENGEWVLCRTCAEHYELTRRGRKPNDPKGFKVKMNGKFQEAAWVMHKSRVVAHRWISEEATETPEEEERRLERRREIEAEIEARRIIPKRRRIVSSEGEEHVEVDSRDERESSAAELVHLPTTGWRCPGIVPEAFYREHVELVHAFAKYHVGSYRVNVVRDLRSDKVMLFSHDCENQIVHRERTGQPDSCERCYSVWLHNKSFKRILKKMDRYTLVEDILRHSWSMSVEELSVLSKFKHSSDMNLNLEGRKLKQAAMAAAQHFNGSAKSSSARYGVARTSTNTTRNERFDRVQQPLSMEVMLQLQSLDSSMHEEEATPGASEALQNQDGSVQQPASPNPYLIQQSTPATQVVECVPSSRDE